MKLLIFLILAVSVITLAACSPDQSAPPSTVPANTVKEGTTTSVPAETSGYSVTGTPEGTPTKPVITITPVQGLPLYKGAEEIPTPGDLKERLNIPRLSCRTYRVNAELADVVSWYKNLVSSYTLSEEVRLPPPDNPEIMNSLLYYRDKENGVFVGVLHDLHITDGVTLIIAEGPWSIVETSGIRKGPQDWQTPPPQGNGDTLYEIYPLTDDAPVLELYWGPPDLDMKNIARFTPYGIWEGPYEPAVEMQFYTFSSHDPVYAPCAGTIVYIWQGVDPATGNQQYAVTMRYGRNYGIVLHHLVDVPEGLKAGNKVEARTLIGYTQGQMGVGWWEIEVAARVGDVVRTRPPYDFFSPESKKKLDAILLASKEKSPYNSWTVTHTDFPSNPAQGMGSWIQDMGGKQEWWTSGERVGLQYDPDTLKDFLKANNMEWLIQHYSG